MIIQCPVCGSTERTLTRTSLCFVSQCLRCKHQYTAEADIFKKEVYDESYFQKVHFNWFANPHYKLFSLVSKILLDHQDENHNQQYSILDVGCGKGALLNYMSPLFPNASLVGIDLSDPPAQSLLGPNVKVIRADYDRYNSGQSFSAVISTLVIEHIYQPKHFLRNHLNQLDNNGLLLVVTNDVDTPLYLAAKYLRFCGIKLPFERLYNPHHVNHFSKKSFRRLARSVDLSIIASYGINVPMHSLDIPIKSPLVKNLAALGVRVLFLLGSLVNHRFLQIHVLKRL